MHLNLKDDETVELVTEVARRLGLTKTGAVRQMARERLADLERSDVSTLQQRERHALDWLEQHVWAHATGVKWLSKVEEDDLLGFDETTS